jgi:hypothetical protein
MSPGTAHTATLGLCLSVLFFSFPYGGMLCLSRSPAVAEATQAAVLCSSQEG